MMQAEANWVEVGCFRLRYRSGFLPEYCMRRPSASPGSMIVATGSSPHNREDQTPQLVLKLAPKPYYSVSTPTTTLAPGTALLPSVRLCQIPIFSDDDPANIIPKRCWQCLQLLREPVFCGRCKEEWYCSRDCTFRLSPLSSRVNAQWSWQVKRSHGRRIIR